MTELEKMIWAAVYARVITESGSPHFGAIEAHKAISMLRDFSRLDDRNYGIELAREMVNG